MGVIELSVFVMELERKILDAAKASTQGIDEGSFGRLFPDINPQEIVACLNALLVKGRITTFRDGKTLYFREVAEDEAVKFKGLGPDELTIYQLIEHSQNIGIWSKDLKTKSGLQTTHVSKILATLESRKLIKRVPSISGKNKKVYMLYNVEPSRDVTGGAWYSDQEFDSEFINVLYSHVLHYVTEKVRCVLRHVI
eukprot:c8263_g2_i1.p1 GENE.c8263_g2_i1~~c8263_g2_i1.p1  ORF type:complete len:196 (-),score=44.99 c8263_g2_i1:152-739(-)